MVSEGVMQADKGQHQSVVQLSCKAHEPHQGPTQQDTPRGATVTLLS